MTQMLLAKHNDFPDYMALAWLAAVSCGVRFHFRTVAGRQDIRVDPSDHLPSLGNQSQRRVQCHEA
jgi:hypothetical protein